MKQIVWTRRRSRHADLALALASTLGLSHVALAADAPISTGTGAPSALAPSHASFGFHPVMGKEMVFRLASKGIAGVNMEALASQMSPAGKLSRGKVDSHVFEVSATLGLRAVGRDGEDWLFAARLQDPRYVVDGQADARASALQISFLIRFSSQGQIKAMEFPVKYPEEGAVAIRALVEPIQVVLGDVSSGQWTVSEKGVNGASTVVYQNMGVDQQDGVVVLSRTVSAARRALPGTESPREARQFRTRVDASSGEIDWALDGSGPMKIAIQENTTTLQGNQTMATSQTSFTAQRVTDSMRGLSSTLSDARLQLKDPKYARASFYKVPASLDAEISSLDWQNALAFYRNKIVTATSDAVLMMKFYLRKHPDQVQDFVRVLDERARQDDSEEAANFVGYGFAAIGSAGHTEAQQAIVDVLASTQYAPLTRQKALDGTLSIEMPERFVPVAVWDYREKLPRNVESWWEVMSIATNIYGQLGNVNSGVPENTEEVINTLGRALRNGGDAFEKRAALMALGNINDPARVLPLTQSYFTHADKNLRARAYDTFLNAQGEENFQKFARFFAGEADANIKDEASVIAVSMGESKARNLWALEQVRSAKDPLIQNRAVLILGRGLQAFPENKESLRDLLDTVRDRDVRKAIYSFVTPRGAR